MKKYSGGVDRIISLAKNVSKHNVNVYLMDRSLRKSFFSLLVDGDKYYHIEKNGAIKEQSYPLHLRFLFPGIIKLWQEIFNRIVSLLTFSSFSAVGLAYLIDPYLMLKLHFICRKERIDLIQSECTVTVLSSFFMKKLLGIPLVFDEHNIETEMARSLGNASSIYIAISKLIEKMDCTICDSIFVVSQNDADLLETWGLPKSKMQIIPNSVEPNRFSTALNKTKIMDQYGLKDEVVMIFHGTLSYPPNEEAVEILGNSILQGVLSKSPNAYLFLVGKDPPKLSNSHIIATGFVQNLSEYIAAADIAVVPLLRGGGTRIKILEYMACGKAVVSTIKGAEGLDLQNGQDILLTKYPDSKFIDLIVKLIQNPDLRKSIGKNARKKVESSYNWQVTSEKAVQTYNKLVCKNKQLAG